MKKGNYVLTALSLFALCAGVAGCNNETKKDTDNSTKGLAYTLIEGKSEYKLVGIGTANSAKEIVIASTYNGKPVTEIATNAFQHNATLAKVSIPNGIKSIENGAFQGCTALTEVTLPASVATLGERVFAECTSLTEISVAETNEAYTSLNGNLYTKDGSVLVQYALGDTATSYTTPDTVTTIAKSACSKASNLTTVVMGASVITVDDYAFMGCAKLNDLTLGNNVQKIGTSAFSSCLALTSIFIPQSVVKMSNNVFYDTDNIYGGMNLTIYCEIDRQPSGWESAWNYCFPSQLPVEWGYIAEEE